MAVSLIPHAVCLLLILTPTSSSDSVNCSTMKKPHGRAFIIRPGCNNTAALPEQQKRELQAWTTVLLVPLLYLVVFVVGFPANLLALWVLLFRTKMFPSTILLVNLTCCDLLLLLLLPFRIVYHFQGNNWSFGEAFCRIVTGLFYGNMYGSMVCLMLISVDRYVALVHPFGAKTLRSNRISLVMSMLMWVVAAVATGPLLASKQSYTLTDPPIRTCHDALPEKEQQSYFLPYFATLFFLFFLVPLLVVLFCYGAVLRTLVLSGSRYAHAIRVTVLVLVVFVVCFLPSNVLLIMHYSEFYRPKPVDDTSLYVPYMISLALSTFNSCIDPFIFYYVSEDFREKARHLLCCSPMLPSSSSSSSGNQASRSSAMSRSNITLLSMSSKTTGHSDKDTVRS